MDMDPATALSATPTKEATHLSMIARHDLTIDNIYDLTKEIFDSCHVLVSSSTVLGDSVLSGGSATLSATPTKEATHLSGMKTRHRRYSSAVTCLCLAARFRHTPSSVPNLQN